MKTLEFHNNYHVNGAGLSTVSVIHADSNRVIGYLVSEPHIPESWGFYTDTGTILTIAMLTEITARLKCIVRKTFTAPPTGFFKCIGCGVQVPVKPVPYEEQCDCPSPSCDGQLMCNEYTGWNKSC